MPSATQPTNTCDRVAPGRVADDHGNPLALVGVNTWFTTALGWAGDELILLRRWSELAYGTRVQVAIERRSASDGALRARTLLPGEGRLLAVSRDARQLVIASGTTLRYVDASSGEVRAEARTADEIGALTTAGTGDDLIVAAATGTSATLFDARGTVLATYPLAGTTPTITRVYRAPTAGGGVMHDNILRDSPTWASRVAISTDQRFVAIAGSDSMIRLVDRRSKRAPRLLAFAWPYTERRKVGGNPDLNAALALQFAADGKHLLVVHRHGEVITWSTATGTLVRKLDAACTPEEAAVFANRYAEPNEPRRAATAEDRASCARATSAIFARDGSWVAMNNGFMRLRKLGRGEPLVMLPEREIQDLTSVSAGGMLAMADIYGHVSVWSAEGGVKDLLPTPISTGPLTPQLSPSGHVLQFRLGSSLAVWDLTTGTSPAGAVVPPDTLLASSPEGDRMVVARAGTIELRDATGTKPLGLPAGDFTFSASGRVLLDRVSATRELIVRDLARETEVTIKQASGNVLSSDGGRLATFGRQVPLEIWDTRTGAALAKLEPDVRHVAFFGDGRRLVAIAQPDRKAVVRFHDLERKHVIEVPLDGRVSAVAVGPDDEVLVAVQDRILRLGPDGTLERETQHTPVPNRVSYAAGGHVVMFEHYDHVELRRTDDALTRVATVYPLLSNGFLVVSADGAVVGTPDAPDSTIVRVTGGTDAVLPGRDAWDRLTRPDVYTCALSGSSVSP